MVLYVSMKRSVPNNERGPGSEITDARILLPGDELRLYDGVGLLAVIAVLDSHNPAATEFPTLGQLTGDDPPHLGHHYHILVQMSDGEEIMSTGLFVHRRPLPELIFPHITASQDEDPSYGPRLERLHALLSTGTRLVYASDQEQLSHTPEGQAYLDDKGRLRR